MNKVILSLGGVVSINGQCPTDASDAEISAFLDDSLEYAEGRQPITVAEVRAQAEYLAALENSPPANPDPVEKIRAFLASNPDVAAILG